MSSFPKNFLWGAATSAHQVEGHNHNDWTEWEKLGRVKNGERSGRASGHFERYREDFALAQQLGQNAHRFSIEWSRIEPKPGQIDMDAIGHYRDVIAELHRLKLEPMVTLWHFTNPIWIRELGGWTNRATVDAFARFVQLIVNQLGSQIQYWVTLNEPTVYTAQGYLGGFWPPERQNPVQAWQAIRNLVAAHRLAAQIIHRQYPHARVGIANNLNNFRPSRTGNQLDRAAAWFADFWHNRWVLNQTYDTVDFIGLNYYFDHPVRFKLGGIKRMFEPDPDPNLPLTDLGWPIFPAGLARVLESLQPYQLPIIITENGLADAADARRAGFIRHHVAVIERALERGVDIRGYFHWSLIDNFEWQEGFRPRFGLIEIDYPTMRRTIRPSAHAYRQLIDIKTEAKK